MENYVDSRFNNIPVYLEKREEIQAYLDIILPNSDTLLPNGQPVISYVEFNKLVLRISNNGDKSMVVFQISDQYYVSNGNPKTINKIILGWRETEGSFMLVWEYID